MEDERVTKAEYFIEKYNGKIQIGIALITAVVGVVAGIKTENVLASIATLLVAIVFELVIISLKDSLVQRKLNRLGTRIEMINGALFRVSDFNLSSFFSNSKKSFFVSGMTLSKFLETYRDNIENLLKDNKKVNILVAEPESVIENAKLYHGSNNDEKSFYTSVCEVFYKQIIAINTILDINNVEVYLKSGKLEIGLSQTVFSTSFVAYDIWEEYKKKRTKEIKASFYQYKCKDPKSEPNILVNSIQSKDWYDFFKNTITMQWEDAIKVQTLNEVRDLRKRIEDLSSIYSKI